MSAAVLPVAAGRGSAITRDMNGVPWSVSTSFGIPTQLARRDNSLAMFFAVALRSGMPQDSGWRSPG